MRKLTVVAVVLAVLGVPILRPVQAEDRQAQGDDLSPKEVISSMERGIRFLKGSQDGDHWSEWPGQQGGVTCLCTLALLSSGVGVEEEHVKRALHHIRGLNPTTTYVISLQTMVLCKATPIDDQDLISHNVEWLEKAQIKDNRAARRGAWTYDDGHGGLGDGSNSQFALLALYEAQRLAEANTIQLKIDPDTWERAHHLWRSWQSDRDGSWGYYPPLPGTGSMTCAGICSLVISNDVVHQPDARIVGDTIDACYRDVKNDDAERVERGIEWLRRHFHVDYNPPRDMGLWRLYYLYALERTGRLTARRKIGEHDWYREGARYLIRQNGPDTLSDSWQGSGHAEDNKDIGTSLALLFLAKGRRPVLMAKIKHGSHDEDWNRRRNDVNNMTIYVEGKWKHELTWQVIDIKDATVDDLLQVPVLYYTGGVDPLPDNDAEVRQLAQKLRDYIDHGGFLFAEADCCTQGFDRGFRKLMTLVFPEQEYRLKLLDPSHPVWRFEESVSPDVRPLWGIDYGCRTSVVYAPADPVGAPRPSLSCLWELSRGNQKTTSKVVNDQIHEGLAIGVNILGYATNREVLPKEQRFQMSIVDHVKPDAVDRDKVYVALLRHPGGCDTAPRALANLMEAAAKNRNLRADLHPKLIGIEDEALFDFPLVFMHGRNAFHLTDNERACLRKYVERGGMIFADSICASEAFTKSFQSEMTTIFPKNALEPISPRDPIWTTRYGGYDLQQVSRHDPQGGTAGQPLKASIHRVPPELSGIRLGDRYGVIFSAFDLSCALEKQDSVECRGYVREDAARLGINVLMYSLQH